MRTEEAFINVGRAVALFPTLRHITGSINATILFCQLLYWEGKQHDPNGWIYKTSKDLQEETGLTYKEQSNARRMLVKNNLIFEKYERLYHRMSFKLNLKEARRKWNEVDPALKSISKPLKRKLKSNQLAGSEIDGNLFYMNDRVKETE